MSGKFNSIGSDLNRHADVIACVSERLPARSFRPFRHSGAVNMCVCVFSLGPLGFESHDDRTVQSMLLNHRGCGANLLMQLERHPRNVSVVN